MDEVVPKRKKRTKSEILRAASVQEYLQANAKPNGNGWRGFFKSNLFTALILFLLSQSVVVTGLAISYYFKTSQLAEWKGQTEGIIKRMDEAGTVHDQYEAKTLNTSLAEVKVRVDKIEEETKHIGVLESEHRRLTKDVEDLRNGKK